MPKFSVCIPTRERHHTLPYAVASVLNQTCGDFEVIVQDNFSSDETYKSLKQFDDRRLKYQRSDRRLPMHVNWEAALKGTTGEYVIYIGDDDALLPFCLERADELLAIGDVELLAWLAHTYYWPGVADEARRNHLTLDMRAGAMWAKYVSPEARTIDRAVKHENLPPGVMALDSREILKNWLRHDGVRIYAPTYHNLVSRTVINKVREAAGGTYFFNPLPDFGTLIANLYVSEELIYYTAPLSMTGHSPNSSGGALGHQCSWDRHLRHFIGESGWSKEQLLPSVFEPFLWTPALLAGCYEDVKRKLFPDNDDFQIDWKNFLISAAAGVNGEPESAREPCKQWLLESADRIGLPREKLSFPNVDPFKRQAGTLLDPEGRAVYLFVDGDAIGLRTVTDAVRLAVTLQPSPLYSIAIVPPPEPVRPPQRAETKAGGVAGSVRRLLAQCAGRIRKTACG